MRPILLQVGVLVAVVTLTVVIGRGPASDRWGADGLRSLYAAVGICLAAAVVAAVPLGLAAAYRPAHAAPAALAATGIRLLGTLALGFAYQALRRPHEASFLFCLLATYLILLVAETAVIVYIVARAARTSPPAAK